MKLRYEFGFSLGFTAFEIYNEKVIDLLMEKKTNRLFTPLDQNKKHKGYTTEIDQLTNVNLEDLYAFRDFFDLSQNNKKIGDNKLNSKSSRSHCIYKLSLIFNSKELNLYLIDLAGVERSKYLDMSKGVSTQMSETCNINKSLTTLSRCFQALRDNNIVPYRESKLTKLLFDNMAKDVSISIIINFNPSHSSFEDNFRVLEFASVAKDINSDHIEKNVSFVAMKSRNKIVDSSYKYLNERFNESKKKKRDFIKEKQDQLNQCLLNLKSTLSQTLSSRRFESVKDTLHNMNGLRMAEIRTQLEINARTLQDLKGHDISTSSTLIEPCDWENLENDNEIERKVLSLMRKKKFTLSETSFDHERDLKVNQTLGDPSAVTTNHYYLESNSKIDEQVFNENAEAQKEVARSNIKGKNVNKEYPSYMVLRDGREPSLGDVSNRSFRKIDTIHKSAYNERKTQEARNIPSIDDIAIMEQIGKTTTMNTQDSLSPINPNNESVRTIGFGDISILNDIPCKYEDLQQPKQIEEPKADEVNQEKPKEKAKRGKKPKIQEIIKEEIKVPVKEKPNQKTVFDDFLDFVSDPPVGKKPISNISGKNKLPQSKLRGK